MENCDYYIYRHLKPCGEVFYIGVSKLGRRGLSAKSRRAKYSRAFNKTKRNTFWKNKVKKHPDYEVQILKTGLKKEEAIELEVILIDWYKRADCCGGTLVNLTDGGDGLINLIRTEEHKENMSKSLKGRIFSKEHCENISKALKGKPLKEETKLKLSITLKGTRLREENPFYGKKHSDENKKAWSENKKGCLHPQARVILNTQTGIFYISIHEACFSVGLKYSTLRSMLQGCNKNKTYLIYC